MSQGLKKHRLHAAGKDVDVYPSAAPDRPVIYLNAAQGEGDPVWQALRDAQSPDFTLVAVSGLEWDRDMAPWDSPPVFKGGAPCTGGADAYLQLLTEEIVPEAEALVPGKVLWRGLAGYSLAGLFALYALYRTDRFSRAASISGSLWFPGFRAFAASHEMGCTPERLYLSLGDQECRTRNPVLRTVQEDTEALCALFRQRGIPTEFRLNPGNHFKDTVQRTAAGLAWIVAE